MTVSSRAQADTKSGSKLVLICRDEERQIMWVMPARPGPEPPAPGTLSTPSPIHAFPGPAGDPTVRALAASREPAEPSCLSPGRGRTGATCPASFPSGLLEELPLDVVRVADVPEYSLKLS